jgi:hypothetical protein
MANRGRPSSYSATLLGPLRPACCSPTVFRPNEPCREIFYRLISLLWKPRSDAFVSETGKQQTSSTGNV